MMERRQFLVNLVGGTAFYLLGKTIVQARSLTGIQNSNSLQYRHFLEGIYQQAIRQGMNAERIRQALDLSTPNLKVIQLDHKQPEFTLTWQQYYQKVITSAKVRNGQDKCHQLQKLLSVLWKTYQVDPSVILGIWGLESDYGKHMGKFKVIDALATLAYEGRRTKFFRSELMNALTIINHQDIRSEAMLGSYAGAMGQPQFMPSAYLRYAVDFSGKGQRDIWTNIEDVLASIANYLKKSGWHASEPWGQRIRVPQNISSILADHRGFRSLGEWQALGIRREDGGLFSKSDVKGRLIVPDGGEGQAFVVYRNFNAIRRYNPSDYYALAVGLLGDAISS